MHQSAEIVHEIFRDSFVAGIPLAELLLRLDAINIEEVRVGTLLILMVMIAETCCSEAASARG